MKIKYLGTAASEGIPAIFCKCDTCKRARELGGKNIRSRSQALIDGKILIDFACDTYMHVLKENIDLADVNTLLITHAHGDHCVLIDLGNRRHDFAHISDCKPLNIYASEDIFPAYASSYGSLNLTMSKDDPNNINFNLAKAYEPFEADGYTITALRAYHGTDHPYIYIIQKDGKSMLYAHDTDVFYDDVFEYLKNSKIVFDFVSLDCTAGTTNIRYHGHMNLPRNIETRQKLIDCGAANNKTIFCLNHFSHNGGNACYDDMKPIADENGFMLSYDGMEVSF